MVTVVSPWIMLCYEFCNAKLVSSLFDEQFVQQDLLASVKRKKVSNNKFNHFNKKNCQQQF